MDGQSALYALTACSLLSSGIALFSLVTARKVQRANQQLEAVCKAQAITLQTALSGSVGMGQRLLGLEKRVQSLATEKQAPIMDEFAYGQALQMFEQGADVAAVASSCGFSSSEAQLMALVQEQIKRKNQKSPESVS